jgi:mono/diheme cytochrome c family protein
LATSRRTAVLALASILAGTGCTHIDNALAAVPIFAFLRDAPSFDPYEHPLPAPPGTVPFESPNGPVLPALEGSDRALREWEAGPWGQNPLAQDDAVALAMGQLMYERHCSVCHGLQGRGDGPLVGPGKFPVVPPVASGAALALSDGYVYGIIRAGRGLMPAYGARMTHTERWAVVNYINQLQGTAGGAAQPGAGAAPQPGAAGTGDVVPAPRIDTLPARRTDTLPSQR